MDFQGSGGDDIASQKTVSLSPVNVSEAGSADNSLGSAGMGSHSSGYVNGGSLNGASANSAPGSNGSANAAVSPAAATAQLQAAQATQVATPANSAQTAQIEEPAQAMIPATPAHGKHSKAYVKANKAQAANVNVATKTDTEMAADKLTADAAKAAEKAQKASAKAAKKAEKESAKAAKQAQKQAYAQAAMADGKRSHKGLLITVATALGVLAVAYIAFGIFFSGHYGFNTKINGKDVSFKTVAEAREMLEDEVANYTLSVQTIDGQTYEVTSADVGMQYVSDNRAQQVLDSQSAFLWPQRAFASQDDATQLKPTVTYDDSMLRDAVSNLAFMSEDAQVAPTNAEVGYDEETGQYVVMPEQWGSTVYADAVISAVEAAVGDVDETVNLFDNGCYVAPEITSSDETLIATANAYNTYAGSSITYDMGFGDPVVLDGNTIMSWIVLDDELNATLDVEQITEWVDDFAATYDTVGLDKSFTTTYGEEVTISGGTYGWAIDESEEIVQIQEDIASQTAVEREPIWSSTAYSHDTPEWGNTYVEVSIADQHMWYYQDGTLVFESDVVTGLPTSARATCTGAYSIIEKLSPTVLRGPQQSDGSYEWESPVTYWMRITWSGTGFHDATWRSSFGGTIYQSNGSHGCINMPYSKAQELYGIITYGTPVILY